MADNFLRFTRFTSLPANISEHGLTRQEFELQRGKPDPNPFLSPMAAPDQAELRLAVSGYGSDRARLRPPAEPAVNPFEGPGLALSHGRAAHAKLVAPVVQALTEHIEGGGGGDAQLGGMMLDSLGRVRRLRDYLGQVVATTEKIYLQMIANASA